MTAAAIRQDLMNSVLIIILLAVGTTFAEESDTYTVSFGSSKRECAKCERGYYLVKDCEAGDVNSTECKRCPDGRFAPSRNAKHQCKQCKPHCHGENEIKIANCSADHDIVCGCPHGYWHEKHGTSNAKCLPFLICGKGYGVDKPGTNISDVTCTKCIEGVNFSSEISPSEYCQPCRNCAKEGWKETKACTVMSDAECDIPTTTTTEPTTSLTSGSITDDDNKSNEHNPSVTPVMTVGLVGGVVAFVVIVVLACLAVVLFVYRHRISDLITLYRTVRYRNEDLRQNDLTDNSNPSSLRRIPSTRNSNLVRRSYSNLQLKQGVILENDVFRWLGGKLGNDFLTTTCKTLPGNRLTRVDVERARYPFRHTPDLAAEIDAVLQEWRKMNLDSENKNDRELFIDICKTLSRAGQDDAAIELVEEMVKEFAQ